VVFVSTLRRLFCVCGSCWGNLQPSQTLLLDLSGPLGWEGKATWRGEEGRGRKKGKGRDRKRRSGLNPSKKSLRAPTLELLLNWFIDGKLLIGMGSSFICNTSLAKIFHSKLKRPNCLWRVFVLPATSAATAMATSRSLCM